MSFHVDCKNYILKLIRIQKKISSIYQWNENRTLFSYTSIIAHNLTTCTNDAKMIAFWIAYRKHIRFLIPSINYSGFSKLLLEYEVLDTFVIANTLEDEIFLHKNPFLN